MRDLVLNLLIPIGLLWGLSSPVRSLLVLNWICFMRPYEFSWGPWRSVPTFQIALIFAVASNFYHGNIRLKFPPFLIAYLAFHAWILLSCIFSYDTDVAWAFYMGYVVTFPPIAVFVFSTLNKLNDLKWIIWSAAGSLGLVGAKVGIVLGASGGAHITDSIDGFVGDNNVFGLTLCLCVATLFGLKSTITQKKFLLIFYPLLMLVIVCIVFTKSRGAFLTMIVIMLLSTLASRTPIRSIIILAAVVGLGYLAIPASFFDRMQSLEDVEGDGSAQSRFHSWHLSWEQAKMRPILGVGMDNHMTFNTVYFANEIAGRVNHVAHSIYFQIVAETGFPGLAVYFLLIFWTVFTLHGTYGYAREVSKTHPELVWVEKAAFWMRNGFIGYIFGSAFLNMLVIDYPWYFMWYAYMMRPLLEREVVRRAKAAARRAEAEAEAPEDPAGRLPEALGAG